MSRRLVAMYQCGACMTEATEGTTGFGGPREVLPDGWGEARPPARKPNGDPAQTAEAIHLCGDCFMALLKWRAERMVSIVDMHGRAGARTEG